MKVVAMSLLVLGCTLVLAQAQQSRIVGGGTTTLGAYPYMTALIEKGAKPSSGQFCGAALVAPQWVLTAAHCLEGTPASTVEVWIGGRDLRNVAEGVRVGVTQVIMHPSYRETSQGALVYDFCLLKLARPVTERAVLPLVEAAEQVAPGITSRVLGWGATSEGGSSSSILKAVDLPLVSLSAAGGSGAGLGISHLAAGFAAGGADSCQGDSGGPLMVRNGSNAWVHAGTVSYGDGCARAGSYGIYGNTLTVKAWIAGHIGQDGVNPTPVDDHGNGRSTATTLAVNSSANGNLEKGGDVDFFKVVTSGPGTLTITSTGNTDVVGTLYNSAGTVLLTDDNGAGLPNFRLVRSATAAGTFFFRVAGKTTSTVGNYAFSVAFVPTVGAVGDIAVRLGTTHVRMNGRIGFGAVKISGATVTRTLTLANTGKGGLEVGAVTITGPSASSFRIDTLPATTVAAGKKTSFRVTCAAVSAGALEAQLEIASDDPDETPYRVNMVATATRASGDDHGNSRAEATRILVPSSVRGNIQSGTDLDFFTFTLTAPTTVTIRTTGLVDTYGTLYTATGSVVTRADDISNTNLNFSITRTLIAGTYFVAVEGYDTTDLGVYTLVTSK
jgi:secreted trypsin-like serine protease